MVGEREDTVCVRSGRRTARMLLPVVCCVILGWAAPARAQVGTPSPTLPSNGATNLSSSVTLAWTSVTLATSYEVQLAADAAFSGVLVDQSQGGTSYTVSGLAPGTTFYWRVRAATVVVTGSWSATWSFGTAPVAAPPAATTLLAPVNQATGQATAITFSWGPSSGAGTYTLEVATDTGFSKIFSNISGIGGTSQPVSGLAAGTTYFWRVEAVNGAGTSPWSAAWRFSTASGATSPPQVTLLAPANGSTDQPTTLVVSWNPDSGATHFWLQAATDPSFAAIVVGDSTITATSFQLNYLTASTTYYWRVRGINAAGQGSWSAAWSFTTTSSQIQPPPVPVQLSPANGATGLPTTFAFSWNPSTNADHYFLQVATDNTFSTIAFADYSIVGTSRQDSGLSANTMYYWHVKAVNAGGQSAWSPIWSFTTGPAVVPPGAPVLLLPANGATQQPDSITLLWRSAQGSTRYQLEIDRTSSFSSLLLDDSTLSDTSNLVNGLPAGATLYWRVRGVNSAGPGVWSAAWSFTTRSALAVPSPPALVSPQNGAGNLAQTDTLVWSSSRNAVRYRVQVSQSSGFGMLSVDDSALTDTTKVVAGLSGSTTYYWRAAAINAAGSSGWSSVWTFGTAATARPPSPPVLLAPPDASRGMPFVDTLRWSASPTADGYEVAFSTYPSLDSTVVTDSLTTATRIVVGPLSPLITYFWHVRARNAAGRSAWTGTWSFTTAAGETAGPTLIAPGNNSQNLPATVICSWDAVASAMAYHVEVAKDSLFDSVAVSDSVSGDTHLSVGPLAPGAWYYWRVSARLTDGSWSLSSLAWRFRTASRPAPPGFVVAATDVDYPAAAGGSPLRSSDYRLVGLPGASSIRVASVISGVAGVDWAAYWDNGAPTEYLVAYEFSKNDSLFTFSMGRAFWLIKNGPFIVDTSVPGGPLDSAGCAEIPLHGGWNLITDPFTDTVSWSAVQSVNATSEPLYSFRGAFQTASGLVPGAGFYCFNSGGAAVLRIPQPAAASGRLAANSRVSRIDGEQWTVFVTVKSAGFVDSAAWFGVSPAVQKQGNLLDVHKPAGLGASPEAFFSRPDWDRQYSIFASDIRPLFSDVAEWHLTLEATPYKEATLEFHGLDRLPGGFDVVVLDPIAGRWQDMRSDPACAIVPLEKLTDIDIVVGTREAVSRRLVARPGEAMSVGANYPNPFNLSTQIPVYVRDPSHLSIAVFNVLGQKVADIFNGEVEAGPHLFQWDGTDGRGRTMPSGVYFYRTQAGNGNQAVHRMMLLK